MKKMIILFLLMSLISIPALAEHGDAAALSAMTNEELLALRREETAYLQKINTELGSRVKAGQALDGGASLGKISDLFPDPNLAKVIRDGASKFSVSQPVSQADLDKITYLGLWDVGDVTDLTGIGYLRNLERINAGDISLQHLPKELMNCTKLYYLRMVRTGIVEIPEWIGEMTSLTKIDFTCDGNYKGKITALPDSIGNLIYLEELSLSGNQLTALPESMGNLIHLKSLYLSNNQIAEIPESMWALSLESLSLSGNPIE